MSSSSGQLAMSGPASGSERLVALDAMRGIAIMGVLLAYATWSLGNPPEDTWSKADLVMAWAMSLLVDNKFLTMFAFLFGVGVAQQWRRWDAAGQAPAKLHLRRMAFLLAVGLVHGSLLRNGDILAPYALLGLLLLTLGGASRRTLATTALLLMVTPYLLEALLRLASVPLPQRPSGPAGSYVSENLSWLVYWYKTNPWQSWPQILSLMIAGLLVSRAGVIERLATNRAFAMRVLLASLTIAVLTRLVLQGLGLLWAGQAFTLIQRATLGLVFQFSCWSLAAVYGAAVLLIAQSRRSGVLKPISMVGRMAFTNYLLQGLILVPVCLIFGLFDNVTPTRGLYLSLALAASQIPFSIWWLKSSAMGPLERVWRTVTYGPTARVSAEPSTAVAAEIQR